MTKATADVITLPVYRYGGHWPFSNDRTLRTVSPLSTHRARADALGNFGDIVGKPFGRLRRTVCFNDHEAQVMRQRGARAAVSKYLI